MNEISDKSKKCLLSLARKAITLRFKGRDADVDCAEKDVKVKRGVFVTLDKNGELRGCIGNLEAIEEVDEAVARNSLNAAFADPRFPPVSRDEVADLEIEISILTEPEKLEYSDTQDLINKLSKMHPGLILQVGGNRATYLPQVWEDLKDPGEFLSSLCLKAGLEPGIWKEDRYDITLLAYTAVKFSEKDYSDEKS